MSTFPFLDGFPFGWLWAFLFAVILFRAGGTYVLGSLIARGAGAFPRIKRMTESSRFDRARTFIDQYGVSVVVASFLLIGVQTVVHLAAGSTGMRPRRYLPGLVVGGAMWALIYSTVGFVGFTAIAAAYDQNPVLTVAVGLFVGLAVTASVILNRHAAKKKRAEHTPAEAAPADLESSLL